jgi:MFS family permease
MDDSDSPQTPSPLASSVDGRGIGLPIGDSLTERPGQSGNVPSYYFERRRWTSLGLLAFSFSCGGATGAIALSLCESVKLPPACTFFAALLGLAGTGGGAALGMLGCLEVSANDETLRGKVFPLVAILVSGVSVLAILFMALLR